MRGALRAGAAVPAQLCPRKDGFAYLACNSERVGGAASPLPQLRKAPRSSAATARAIDRPFWSARVTGGGLLGGAAPLPPILKSRRAAWAALPPPSPRAGR